MPRGGENIGPVMQEGVGGGDVGGGRREGWWVGGEGWWEGGGRGRRVVVVGGGRRVMVWHDVHLSHNFIDIFSDVWPQKKACSSVLVEGNRRVLVAPD